MEFNSQNKTFIIIFFFEYNLNIIANTLIKKKRKELPVYIFSNKLKTSNDSYKNLKILNIFIIFFLYLFC